jgi:hypothetical protein
MLREVQGGRRYRVFRRTHRPKAEDDGVTRARAPNRLRYTQAPAGGRRLARLPPSSHPYPFRVDLPIAPTPAAQADSGLWAGLNPNGGAINALAVDPSNGSVVFAGTNAGAYVSINEGANWTAFAPPVPSQLNNIRSLVVVERPTNVTVFAGTTNASIFRYLFDQRLYLPLVLR